MPIPNPSPAWVGQVVRAFVASSFDPDPIHWKAADEAGVAPVRRLCKRPVPGPQLLPTALNRNAFLLGCLDFTEHEPIEHLIVGLGHKSRSTIKIEALLHYSGEPHRIALPKGFMKAAEDYIAHDRSHQLVVFHNHPSSWIDAVFDLIPIASVADRQVMLSQLQQPLVALKSIASGKQIHWFVGQNGFVREFDTPDIVGLLSVGARHLQSRR